MMRTHTPIVPLVVLFSLLPGCGRQRLDARPHPPPETANVVEQHWPDGTVKLRRHVLRKDDGTVINHGAYFRWYDNGAKEYEVTFAMGRKHGKATRWHRNGRKWSEEHYRHGQRHGPSYYWDMNGTKRKEEHHFNGKPHGTWTTWNENGRIKWQGTFEHGKPRTAPSKAPPRVPN